MRWAGAGGSTLACDFRIAAAEAEFWIPEVDLGVPLGVATTTRFVRFVGPTRAKEIIIGGRRYSAAEALALGLVNEVHPGARLAGAVQTFAERLAAKPFRPMAEMKARINAHRAHRHPRGERDDRGLSRPRMSRASSAHVSDPIRIDSAPDRIDTPAMAVDLPDEMPPRWLDQVRVLIQDLMGRSAAETPSLLRGDPSPLRCRRRGPPLRRSRDRGGPRAPQRQARSVPGGGSARVPPGRPPPPAARSAALSRTAARLAAAAPRRCSGRATPSREGPAAPPRA